MVKHYLIKEEDTGWCDSPLTKKGIEQAKKARELLKDIILIIVIALRLKML